MFVQRYINFSSAGSLYDITENKFALLKTKSEGVLCFWHDSSLVAQEMGREEELSFSVLSSFWRDSHSLVSQRTGMEKAVVLYRQSQSNG